MSIYRIAERFRERELAELLGSEPVSKWLAVFLWIPIGRESVDGLRFSQLPGHSSVSGLSLDELRRCKLFLLGKGFGEVGERLIADLKSNFSDVELVAREKFGGLFNPECPEM